MSFHPNFGVLTMSKLVCLKCKKHYESTAPIWRCTCGGILDIIFSPEFPIEKIKNRKPTMWRYREAIPLPDHFPVISFDEGFTPMLEIEIKNKKIWIKQEHLFQTGSYKDRGASVLMSYIKGLGIKQVVEDSSGNAGCAIAAYGAAGGIECDIFVPADTSPAKLIQIESYGAHLNKIPGTRQDTANAVLHSAENIYYASHSWNPFFFHGTKTIAFEIVEQLGWNSPDAIILPVGNGTLLLGAYFGFNEMYQCGIIKNIPKIIGIQAENCAPLYDLFNSGMPLPDSLSFNSTKIKKTIAEGIAISEPIRGKQIMEAVKVSGGYFIKVSEKEIEASLKEILRKGYFIEPTSAAGIAGVNKYIEQGNYQSLKHETLVTVFTGHGLKAGSKIGEVIDN